MGIGSQPRRDVERNHEAIVTAAIALFADAPGATMAEIAHASGTGRSTLYRHFPDRETLITAIYRRVLAEAEAIVGQWLSGRDDDDPIGTVAGLCDALAAIGDRYRFLEHHQGDLRPQNPSRTRDMAAATMTSYLAAHQATGQIRTDLPGDWLLTMLGAIIKGAAKQESAPERQRVVAVTVRSLLLPPAA